MGNRDPKVQILGGKDGGPVSPSDRAYYDAVDDATAHVQRMELGRQWKSTSAEVKAGLKPETAAALEGHAKYLDEQTGAAAKKYAKKPAVKKTTATKKAAPAAKPAAKKAAPAKKK